METEIKIKVPEGMEIDKENSTFECIKFKPKNVTYDDIQNKIMPYTNTVFKYFFSYYRLLNFQIE